MSDPFLAEIRIFPFNFPPRGWAMCNGQLLAIASNTALFSLIGTYYGGNGVSTFALPDLEGNVVVGAGQGPGLSQYDLGQFGGGQTFTLLDYQNPIHTHLVSATDKDGTTPDPTGNVYAKGKWAGEGSSGAIQLYNDAAPSVSLAPTVIDFTGGGTPHNNMMPTLTLNYCIALTGIFPQRP